MHDFVGKKFKYNKIVKFALLITVVYSYIFKFFVLIFQFIQRCRAAAAPQILCARFIYCFLHYFYCVFAFVLCAPISQNVYVCKV